MRAAAHLEGRIHVACGAVGFEGRHKAAQLQVQARGQSVPGGRQRLIRLPLCCCHASSCRVTHLAFTRQHSG